jgi:hypothetical protein
MDAWSRSTVGWSMSTTLLRSAYRTLRVSDREALAFRLGRPGPGAQGPLRWRSADGAVLER